MYEHLVQMATNLVVPSKVLIPAQELEAAPDIRRKRAGYGPIERIGQKFRTSTGSVNTSCVYDVPFIRGNSLLTEGGFWNLPADLITSIDPTPFDGALLAPAPVLNVQYSSSKHE